MDLSCLAANLRRADRAVGRLYGSEIRKSGLEPTQFTLLAVLAQLDQATQGELAERLAVDSTTLTRTLGLLKEKGWIISRPGEDRRQRWIRPTAKGRSRLEAARPHWERAQARLREAYGSEEWSALLDQLVQVTRAAEAA